MRRELDGVRGGECGGELEGTGRAFDHFVGGGEVVRLRYVRHRRPVDVRGDFLPTPGVWLRNDSARVRVILVFRLFIVVGGVVQAVHLVHIRIVQVGGALPPWPGDGILGRGELGGRIREGCVSSGL